MPHFTWTPDMSVGIDRFDAQHKDLLAVTNHLLERMEQNAPQAELGQILEDLLSVTRSHFEDEERVFAEHDYPGAIVHKGEHDKIVAELMALKKYFDAGSLQLNQKSTRFFIEWLEHHVTGSDKNYTNYLVFRGVN